MSAEEDKEKLQKLVPTLINNTVLNPVGMAKGIMIPPPGTDPGVQSLYYMQDAYFAYLGVRLTKWGLAKILSMAGAQKAAELVSKSFLERMAKSLITRSTTAATRLAMTGSQTILDQLAKNAAYIAGQMLTIGQVDEAAKKFAKEMAEQGINMSDNAARKAIQDVSQRVFREVGEQATDEAVEKAFQRIANEGIQEAADKIVYKGASKAGQVLIERTAATAARKTATTVARQTGTKIAIALGRMAARSAFLAALGPIGTAIDIAMISIAIYGLIYDLLDETGIGHVFTRADINEQVDGMQKVIDEAFTEYGMPTYFQDQAEFPVQDLIFTWEPETFTARLTPEWGPMYSKYMDEYMATQGFASNWRDLIASVQESQTGDDPFASGDARGPGPSGPGPGGPSKKDNSFIIITVIVVVIIFLILLMIIL